MVGTDKDTEKISDVHMSLEWKCFNLIFEFIFCRNLALTSKQYQNDSSHVNLN